MANKNKFSVNQIDVDALSNDATMQAALGGTGLTNPLVSDMNLGGYNIIGTAGSTTAVATIDILGSLPAAGNHGGSINITAGDAPTGYLGGDIVLTPGTGATSSAYRGNVEVHFSAGAIGEAEVRLWRDTDTGHTTGNYVALKSSSTLATNVTLTLPITDGNSGDLMQTDGAGVLSFVAPAIANPMTADLNVAGYNIIGSTATGPDNAIATIDILAGDSTNTGHAGDINLVAGDATINGYLGGNITLTPGTGKYSGSYNAGYRGAVEIHHASNLAGAAEIRLFDDHEPAHTSGIYVALKAPTFIGSPAVNSNLTLTLPLADGSNGNVLTTDGAGNLSFTAAGSLSAVVDDTSPQLGGNLDLNSKSLFGDLILLNAGSPALPHVINVDTTNGKVAINGLPNESSGALQITGDLHVEGGVNYRQSDNIVPLATFAGGTNFFVVRDFVDVYTVQSIWSPPGEINSGSPLLEREATLALVRGNEPNQEFLDLYNNGYISETQFGIRMQKRGTGVYRPFVIDYYDGATNTPVLTIDPDQSVTFDGDVIINNTEASMTLQQSASGELIQFTMKDELGNQRANLRYDDTLEVVTLILRDSSQAILGQLTIGTDGNVAIAETTPTSISHLTRKDYVDTTTVSITGDTMTGDLTISNAQPSYRLIETGVAADNGKWDLIASAEGFFIRALNDADTVGTIALQIDRTGTTLDGITLGASTRIGSLGIRSNAGAPAVSWNRNPDTGAIYNTDINAWVMNVVGADNTAVLNFQGYDPAGVSNFAHTFNPDGSVDFDGAVNSAGGTMTGDLTVFPTTGIARLYAKSTDNSGKVTASSVSGGVGIELLASGAGDLKIDLTNGTGVWQSTLFSIPDSAAASEVSFSRPISTTIAPTAIDHLTRKDYVDQIAKSRNVVINGNFDIWQRGTSFAAIATSTFSADRFEYHKSGTMVHTVTRSAVVPTYAASGVTSNYSLYLDVTTADAVIDAGNFTLVTYRIEGYDYARIAGGDATLSFWVKSIKTGIHCVSFNNSAKDRSYVVEYTIAASGVWQKVEITVPLTETGGTWDYTNGTGLRIGFVLASGTTSHTTADAWQTGEFIATSNQVNSVDSTANNFHIAQVQFEKGSASTPFEYKNYQDELAKAQRYYWKGQFNGQGNFNPYANAATTFVPGGQVTFPTTMRDTPTFAATSLPTYTNCTANDFLATTDGAIERLDATAAGTYRAFGGTYDADAEL